MRQIDEATIEAVKARLVELADGGTKMPTKREYDENRGDLPAYQTLARRGLLWSALAKALGYRICLRMDDVTLEQFLTEVRRVAETAPDGRATMKGFDAAKRNGFPTSKAALMRWTYGWRELCGMAGVNAGHKLEYDYEFDDVIAEVKRLAAKHGNVPRDLYDASRPDGLPRGASVCNLHGIEWGELLQEAGVQLTYRQRKNIHAGRSKTSKTVRKTSRPALLRAMHSDEDEAHAYSERLMTVPGSARRWGNGGVIVELR